MVGTLDHAEAVVGTLDQAVVGTLVHVSSCTPDFDAIRRPQYGFSAALSYAHSHKDFSSSISSSIVPTSSLRFVLLCASNACIKPKDESYRFRSSFMVSAQRLAAASSTFSIAFARLAFVPPAPVRPHATARWPENVLDIGLRFTNKFQPK